MEHESLKYEDTRNKILKTALELFSKRGFSGVSTREIAKVASCNIASLNYHFGTKKKLYQECISMMEPKAKYDFESILIVPASREDFETAFKAYCMVVSDFVLENAPTVKLLIHEINSGENNVQNDSILSPLKLRFETFLDNSKSAGIINKDADVKLLSNMVISSIICQKLYKSFQTYENISNEDFAGKIVLNMTTNLYSTAC